MTIAIPAARQKLIERIATARAARKRGDPLPAEDFIRQYYRGVAEEDLAEYRSDELAAAALAHLRFGAVRKPAQPLVRVYNTEPHATAGLRRTPSSKSTVEDMPFLVDSLGMVLTQAGLTIHLMVHPVLAVRRDRRGRLVELAEGDSHATGKFTPNPGSTSRSIASAIRSACASWNRRSSATLERRATGRRGLAGRCASAPSKSRSEIERVNRRRPAQRSPRSQGAARVDGGQSLHLPRLSPVPVAPRPLRRRAGAAARNRPGHPAHAPRLGASSRRC